jgi:holo-[acyl-carrier protein] synthase
VIFGIGTDIVELARIERLHQQYGERFARRVLGPNELAIYFARGARAAATGHNAAVRYIAKRFAAKEAFSKALGTGLRAPMSLLSVEILNNAAGQPYAAPRNALAQHMERLNLQAHVSISDEQSQVLAFVVLEQKGEPHGH